MRRLMTFILLLLWATPSRAQQDDWSKVIEAAKKEGAVIIYTALGGPFLDAPLKSFEQKYGVRVEQIRARATEVVERIRAEQTNRRYIGDLYMGSNAGIQQRAETGYVQPLGAFPERTNIAKSTSGLGAPVYDMPSDILINTRLVPPDQEPKRWTDLLAPRWKGKLLSDDIRAPGVGLTFFEVLFNTLGRAFHERLAAQNLVVTRNNREAELRVARGEFPIYLPQQLPFALALKGLPVKAIIPEEGAPYASVSFGLLNGAPHPNASRLLINYFLELDQQIAFANAGLIPVVKEAGARANAEVRPYMAIKLLGEATVEGQDRAAALAAEIYK